jgi:hypothetical protein
MAVQIQLRRDTASNWTTNNPTLAQGEFAIETDTDKYKIGDGSTAWTSLGYSSLPAGTATIASPTFTGVPAGPTASANTSTTQLATTAFVMTEVGDYLPTATASSTYAPLASPDLTGNPTAPTQSASNNSTRIATTAYVDASGGSSDEIVDADNDTKIQVEESSDEDKIRFDTGGTERAVIDSSGLEIKTGNLIVPSGNGIDFSAASDAAGMTSELLDDYEEGTWTPTFTPGTSGTITPNTIFDTGGYIKIGRLVYLQGYVGFSAVSSPVGTLVIGGLPFTSATLTDRADRTAFWINYVNPSVDEGAGVYLSLSDGASTMTLAVGNGKTAQYSANRANYVDTGTAFNFNCTYYANA